MSWEELQELRRNTPEPGPPSPSTSKRGSVGPRGSSPYTPRQPPLPQLPNTIDDTERKMIEARKELAEVALRFQVRPPRSPLDSTSLGVQMNGDDEIFDETTHPFDETTHPFDETTHPFDEPQTQIQDAHPFGEDPRIPSPETHLFDEDTRQPPDIIVGGQGQHRGLGVEASGIRMGISPVPSTPGSSKRRTEPFTPRVYWKAGMEGTPEVPLTLHRCPQSITSDLDCWVHPTVHHVLPNSPPRTNLQLLTALSDD
jgi:hypothetical protein